MALRSPLSRGHQEDLAARPSARGSARAAQPGPIRSAALRAALARLLERRLARGGSHLSADELAAPALVFAPHPDDECLGCGGAILRKTGAQADVGVVFVSDGSASHRGLIEAESLRQGRMREGRAAAARLGVPGAHVTFLGHPDGELGRSRAHVTADIAILLEQHRPAQVFVPHADEPPADHRAVRASVLHALASWPQAVQVLEYPVWWWLHWPWVRLSWGRSGIAADLWRRTLRTGFGCRPARPFNRWVDLGGLLERKRAALAEHASQMTRPLGQPRWPVLADVAGGDFLGRLLRDREFFMSYRMQGGRRIDD